MKHDQLILISEFQKRFWLEWVLNPESNRYNEYLCYQIEGDFKPELFKAACEKFCKNELILHTIYNVENATAKIKKFSIDDIFIETEFAEEIAATEYIKAEVRKLFDLTIGPLINLYLIKISNADKWYFVLNLHHIIGDAIFGDIFSKEVVNHYNALLSGEKYVSQTSAFEDCVLTERSLLDEEAMTNSRKFWQEFLADCDLNVNLPLKQNGGAGTVNGRFLYFDLDQEQLGVLKSFAKLHKTTLFILLSAIYGVVLAKYTNQEKLVISYPINTRPNGYQNTVGCFVNNVPLKIDLIKNKSLADLIADLNMQRRLTRNHQLYSLTSIIQDQRELRNEFKVDYFNVGFVEANLNAGGMNLNNVKVNSCNIDCELDGKYPLLFAYDPRNPYKFQLRLEYQNNRLDLFVVEALRDSLLNLIANIEKISTCELNCVGLVPLYQSAFVESKPTLYPSNELLHTMFMTQAYHTPANIAIIYESNRLSYHELNERSNQLANYLKTKYRIAGDDLIALCIDRSEWMLVCILGILKAGGAYVPVDPSYPSDRIEYILEDSGAKVVLTNSKYVSYLSTLKGCDYFESIDSDDFISRILSEEVSCPPNDISSSNLAYVIYTSGTTGKPKGVMLEHRAVVNRIVWMNKEYPLKDGDIVLQKTPFVFDVSVWELFWAIWYGAGIVFAEPDGHKDSRYLADLIEREQISIIHFVPSMLSAFENTLNGDESLPTKVRSLRYIFCSGEALNILQVKESLRLIPGAKIHNLYGPTEAAVDVLYYDCNNADTSLVYIGRPIDNTSVYVLDNHLNILPFGAIGELFIGGVCLARGYINKPELTNEKFISNPFQNEAERQAGKNQNLYRTGDLVRMWPDGNIEYLGRNDFQVKLRGFRIELGEIENALSSYSGIKQAVVIDRVHKESATGEKYLVGYYVSDGVLNDDELDKYLRLQLPDYMVPSVFMYVDKLPLTINGKLDRKALPDPEFRSIDTYVAPRNDLEEKICAIYKSTLNLTDVRVGIRDDFFRLGGDSIVSIRLVSGLRQRLNIDLTVKDIFNYKTVERLYDYIVSKRLSIDSNRKVLVENDILHGEVSLLPIQKWFFYNVEKGLFKNYNHWNQAFLIDVPELKVEVLNRSIEILIKTHDNLRLRFNLNHNNYTRSGAYYNQDTNYADLQVLDVSQFDDNKIYQTLTKLQSNFDIVNKNSFVFAYIKGYKKFSYRLFFAAHHLLIDAVSWRILVEHLQEIYTQLLQEQEMDYFITRWLKENKFTSYRQWIQVVNNYAENNINQTDYWNEVISDLDLVRSVLFNKINVSYDSVNPLNHDYFDLSCEVTKKLLTQVNDVYLTNINEVLLTAFAISLSEIFDLNTQHILMESHGREIIDDRINVSSTVGWFTTKYPVRLNVNYAKSVKHNLLQVKSHLRGIPDNGIGFGSLINNPQPELLISFNYLGQFDGNNDGESTGWNITQESFGRVIGSGNNNPYVLDLNGVISNKQFRLYIDSRLSIQDTKQLSSVYKKNLELVIDTLSKYNRKFLTIEDINSIIGQEYLDKIQRDQEVDTVYLANSLQQGFIYHFLNKGNEDDAYIEQIIFEYKNDLNVELYKKAWELAIVKFPGLRIRFAWDSELVQIIDRNHDLVWCYLDYSDMEVELQKDLLAEYLHQDRFNKFSLSDGNLFRVHLIKQHTEKYTCVLSNHHILLDGWSNPVLLSFVNNTYLALVNNNLVNCSLDFAFLEAQKYLQTNNTNNDEFWKTKILDIEERPNINGMFRLEKRKTRLLDYDHILDPQDHILNINGKLYQNLKQFNQQYGVTLNAILQFAWHKLLSSIGCSATTVVGTTVSGRNLPINNVEDSVGLFINTLPLIIHHEDDDITILDKIKYVQDSINELNTYSQVNLVKINSGRSNVETRIFDNLFAFENYPAPQMVEQLQVSFVNAIEKLDYPLVVIAYEQVELGHIVFKLKYAGELFDLEQIEHLLNLFEFILTQILNNPTAEVARLKYILLRDLQLLEEWNSNQIDFRSNSNLVSLFEEQVAHNPDKIALVINNVRLTYRHLNNNVNQIANELLSKNSSLSQALIGLFFERNEYMVIGILAALKCGAAYVPIDPKYTEDRIHYIFNDAKLPILLTTSALDTSINNIFNNNKQMAEHVTIFYVDTILNSSINLENPGVKISPNDLAYIIYTSGTTGKPKGVLIEHRSVINLISGLASVYDFSLGDKSSAFTSYVFDVSVAEFFTPLLNGAELHIFDEDLRSDVTQISQYMMDNKLNYVYLPPVMLANLPRVEYPGLIGLIYAGEPCDSNVGNYWSQQYKLYNYYGPTEVTIYATGKQILGNDVDQIGRPIQNTTIYILDKNLNQLPVGAIGELYIGGIGVARGYLNRDDLTQERFITNPYYDNSKSDPILYKTGDLARYLQDGNLEYIGRNDFQVKIKGFRVELGEIETALNSYDGIRQSVVIVKEHRDIMGQLTGNKHLIAYYIFEHSQISNSAANYVNDWELVYEDEYADLDLQNYKDNMGLWKSSYTNQKIPQIDMQEWVDNTVSRIKQLSPQHVFEVGSGSGLILFNLLENCKSYVASDFSNNAILHLNKVIDKEAINSKVTTICCRADEINMIDLPNPVDTIIINSVIQYFPDINYLIDVIQSSINKISASGTIFIGDVRDYRLLELFHFSILNYNEAKITQQLIDYYSLKDKELLVSPQFFIHFKQLNHRVTHVEILPKLGSAIHEMNKFRYDVVLHIDSKAEITHISPIKFSLSTDLATEISENVSDNIFIKYPNSRLKEDYVAYNNFKKTLINQEQFMNKILNTDELFTLAKQFKYHLKIFIDPDDIIYLDLVFYKNLNFYSDSFYNYKNLDFSKIANIPSVNAKLAESKLASELKAYLNSILPDYMLPNYYIRLPSLPLTINGKLDRRSLPDPEFTISNNYVAPRNELENIVCSTFAEVLGLSSETVGIKDDFFQLGGDSIVSIQLVSKLRQKLNISISVKDIFNTRNVEILTDKAISPALSNQKKIELKSEQGQLTGNASLLPIQNWFFNNVKQGYYTEVNHWNQSFILKVPELDIIILKTCINLLVEYHDALRLRFCKINDTNAYQQYYVADTDIPELNCLDISDLPTDKLNSILSAWQSKFDISNGPLLAINYIYGYSDGTARIYFAFHHLIIDTISWRILSDNLQTLYNTISNNSMADVKPENILGTKGSSYRQWGEAITQYALMNQPEAKYWEEVLADYSKNIFVRSDISNGLYVADTEIDAIYTETLLKNSNQVYGTQINDILLTAYSYALSESGFGHVQHILLEAHGREEIDEQVDINQTVGWFTTMYPVRLAIDSKLDLGTNLVNIKEFLRNIPNKGIGFGALIGYENIDLPQLSFNYLGQFDYNISNANLWSIIDEYSGNNISHKNNDNNIIHANGLIINGKLKFKFYTKLDTYVAEKLAGKFKYWIDQLINYLSNCNRHYLTCSDIDNVIDSKYLNTIQNKEEINNVYLANGFQQGFIYHHLSKNNDDLAYRVQLIWQYNDAISPANFKLAWEYVCEKYPALRLRFAWENELIQIINAHVYLNFEFIDASSYSWTEIQNLFNTTRVINYDLERAGLFKVTLIKQHDASYYCVFNNNHAILDGWSNPILINSVNNFYCKLQRGETCLPIEVDHTYAQVQKYMQVHQHDHITFWQQYINEATDRPDLSSLMRNSAKFTNISNYKQVLDPSEENFAINGVVYQNILNFSKQYSVTINVLFQYIWHKLLSLYGNSQYTIVGLVTSGRNLPINNIEHTVGCLANSIPLIIKHHDNLCVKDKLYEIQNLINTLNEKSVVNLSEIQVNAVRLFDSVFSYQNYPARINTELDFKFIDVFDLSDYPLDLSAYDQNNQILFRIKYAKDLFAPEMIKTLFNNFNLLLNQIIENVYVNTNSLNLMGLTSSAMQQLNYWQHKLANIENLDMYKDQVPDNHSNTYDIGTYVFNIGLDSVKQVRSLCEMYGFSEFSFFAACFSILLQRYSGSCQDVVFGVPVSGLRNEQLTDLSGDMVHLLPMRVDFTNESACLIRGFVFTIEKLMFEIQENKDISFASLIEKLKLNTGSNENPVFQYIFNLRGDTNPESEDPGLSDKFYDIARFNFDFIIDQHSENYISGISYSKSLYTAQTIERLVESYLFILQQVLTGFETKYVADIQVVIPKHYQNYMSFLPYHVDISSFSNTNDLLMEQGKIDLPVDNLNKYLHEVFVENAVNYPYRIAVTDETGDTSYGELLCHVSQLCEHIRLLDVLPADKEIIAVYLPKSWKQPSSCLAIMAAGYAYLPLNMEWPADRIKVILQTAKVKILVCENEVAVANAIIAYGDVIKHFINIENFNKHILIHIPALDIPYEQIAYVIFTSGSTGVPKGCMLSHKGVMNTIIDINYHYTIDENCAILALADLSFDQSVYDIFGILTAGARIVYPDNNRRKDPEHWWELVTKFKINLWNSVPMFLAMFIEYIKDLPEIDKEYIARSFKFIMLSGEAFPLSLVKPALKIFPSAKLVNSGGATECSIWSIWYEIKKYSKQWHATPYGYAMANQRLYVLDQNLNFCPVGIVGELFISGDGVGLGYLNDPKRTAESFIYSPKLKQMLYKTGDLVKIHKQGHIYFVSRKDFQVKVNGFRIELGEIEYHLDSLPEVKLSAVMVRDNKIIAYLETMSDGIDHEELKGKLSQILPDYMIPNQFIVLAALPRSANGKIDRKSLPDPDFINNMGDYVAPRNELEQLVCSIYAEILDIGVDKIGMKDDFFKLGGNSILAIKLVSRLNNLVLQDNKINVMAIFKHKTIDNLLDSILSSDNSELILIPELNATPLKQYLLSFAQQRLWFIENYEDGSNIYNIPLLYKLANHVKTELLCHAIRSTVARHEVLHSFIKVDKDGSGYLEVGDLETTSLVINHIETIDTKEYEQAISNETNYIFKLDQEYPIRVSLLYGLNTRESYILITVHHIAFDGWSVDIFLREISAYYDYYQNRVNNKPAILELAELNIQYKDFAVWQRNYLTGERLGHQLKYWSNKLAGYEGLNLRTDYPRTKQINYAGDDVLFTLDKDNTLYLKQLAKELGVSLYCVMLSGFNLLLRAYSSQDDIVIGTPIANRHHTQLENLIGFFVNTLALRSIIDAELTISEYIKQIGHEIVEAQLHQDLPFEKLVDELNLLKDESRHPIFQVMFGVQSFGRQTNSLFIETDYKKLNFNVAQFDLTVMIDDSGDELHGRFNYATGLFATSTIQGFIDTYLQILKQLNLKPEKAIKEIGYLSASNYKQVVYTWNETATDYPCDKTIHQLFEEQVARTPENIAVVHEDMQLSYAVLNQRANQLAHYLCNTYNIQGDDLIALCLDRSEYMLIAILAVLKAGGAYVPIDPSCSEDRLNYIVNDTQAKVVITNDSYDGLKNVLGKQQVTNLKTNVASSNMAYVIYTSGTTGKPKGVMIEHKNALNTICAVKKLYTTEMLSKVSFFTSYVFDVSVIEIFTTLLNGYELHVLPESTRKNADAISDYLIRQKINVCYLPPVLLSLLRKEIYPDLVTIIYAGEPCDYETGKYWSEHKQLYNYYGPTEVSIYSSGKRVVHGDVNLIGKPLANTTSYIVDSNLTPVPAMAIGELYIGGAGIARGYLNLPELTTERFIANPFQTDEEKQLNKNTRLYKTGDLVRWLPDGNIEYIGRNDFQVKIHGFRIELGEIETQLSQYPQIKQAAVLVKEHVKTDADIHRYLVGYYVADENLNEEAILKYLEQKLPEYMVPDILVYLDKLPLTINGKLDRKLLPDFEFKSIVSYVAPRNDMERQLCKIYAAVLSLDTSKIGIRDNFFVLGGNSILAIKLLTQINNTYLIRLKVSDIFMAKCIEHLIPIIQRTNYQNIMKLNITQEKLPEMYMIHPGNNTGCEVYFPLADELKNRYICYGIDNYNLYNENKYFTLHELANYYLNIMDDLTPDQEVVLAGWSMGGFMAMEIASILEQMGYKKIKIYAFDTVVTDKTLNQLGATESGKNKYLQHMTELYGEAHAKRIAANYDIEIKINSEPISHRLSHTSIILYKAMQVFQFEPLLKGDENKILGEYIQGLKYNNIDLVVQDIGQIRVIQLPDAHHWNILDYVEIK